MNLQLEMELKQQDKQPALSPAANQVLRMFYLPTRVYEFSLGSANFLIGHAEGFNAYGLIGTERNGIFLACLSDKRMVFQEYLGQSSCYTSHPGNQRATTMEIDRIRKMSLEVFEDFIATRAAYNPFVDRRRRKKALKGDLNVRKRFQAASFTAGRWLTAGDKRTIVHDLEKFLVARIYGGKSFARSRFTSKLYKLLMGPYGHIAHYNQEGFYDAQLMRGEDCRANCQMLADGKFLYGGTITAQHEHMIDMDLVRALATVAGAYLDKHYID